MGYSFFLKDCNFSKKNLGNVTVLTPDIPDVPEEPDNPEEPQPTERMYAVLRSENPALMDKVKSLGWAANDDYMTFDEAAAVTDIGLNFQKETQITSFDEFKYFTGVKTIANNAFMGTSAAISSSLSVITLPDSIESIGSLAFRYCYNLVFMRITKNITSLNNQNSFQDCGIQVFEIDNNTCLDGGSFMSNTPCDTIRLGENCTAYELYDDGVYTLGREKLLACAKKQNFTISQNCKTIGVRALQNLPITSFILPNGITEIMEQAFIGCRNLASISFPDSIAKIGDYICTDSKLTSLTLNGIVTIGNLAFRYNPLTEVVIGDKCTTIGSAFTNVSTITSLTIKATTPPSIQDMSLSGSFTASGKYIKVPSSAVDTYKNANVWKNYASYIVAL